MTTKTTTKPLLDREKQTQPMPGEATPENATQKTKIFSTQEKVRMKALKGKQKR